MAFDDQSTYNKFRAKDCGCEDKRHHDEGCGCSEVDDDCGCCPTGLVSVTDENGNNVGCLSPNDATEYIAKIRKCPEGYVVTYDASAPPVFVGCLTMEDYLSYVAALK